MNRIRVTRADDAYVPVAVMQEGQYALTRSGDLVFRSDNKAVLLRDGDRYGDLEKCGVTVRILSPGTEITITVG